MRAPRKSRHSARSRGALPIYDAGCRRCARLAAFLDAVRAEHPAYFCRPVPPFGDADARARHRRPRAGHARRQRERPAVHRRLRRHPALRDAARLRLRVAARVDRARRRPAARRLPHHQRGQMPAAGQQAAAGRGPRLQRAISPPTSRACPTARAILALGRIAHDAALRALGAAARGASRSRTARGTRSSAAVALFDSYHCSRYNTNTRRLTPAMFTRVFDDDRRAPRADAAAGCLTRLDRRLPSPAQPARAEAAAGRSTRASCSRSLPNRPGRLPHVRRGRRDALRRQGARPEEARVELLPEERARDRASR